MYRHSIVTAKSSMGALEQLGEKNVPIQIDVSLAVEKEMTSALTGKVANPEKIVQKISDKMSIVTQEGTSEVETLLHYQCTHCDKNFLLSNKYKAHCLEEHGITNPYKCAQCENTYTNESSLRVHLRTHKNQKPYVCEECGRTFAQCSTWMAHMVRHSGATPHICDICGKAFATKGDLATHSRIHKPTKPFSCSQCGLSFPRKSNYIRHMRTHTGEKPYSCEYCSKSFARSENCKEHERLHTKERPFTCELCGMAFSDSGNFSKHKKNHIKKLIKKNPSEENIIQASNELLGGCANSEVNSTQEKATKKTRRKHKNKKIVMDITEQTVPFSSVPILAPPPIPAAKVVKRDPTPSSTPPPLPPPPQPLTISLVRQPAMLTKQMPVSFNGIIMPVSEADRNVPLNEFIKLNTDNLAITVTMNTANDNTCINTTDKQQINPETLMNVSESLKLPNYQFPIFGPTQTGVNPMMTDLNFPSNSLTENHAFMMMDYTRDTSYSFPNDNNLILQENLFNRSPTINLTGTDSFIYNGALVPSELNVTSDEHSTGCDLQTDFDIGTSSSYFPTSSTTFDDDLEEQPLDTNKFLNEQYLVKSNKPNASSSVTEHSILNSADSLVIENK